MYRGIIEANAIRLKHALHSMGSKMALDVASHRGKVQVSRECPSKSVAILLMTRTGRGSHPIFKKKTA